MKVAHLPFNIASQISTTVRALRDIGVEARGLAKTGIITSNDIVETYPARPAGIAGYLSPLKRYWQTLRLIAWADVVHWHYGWALHDALDVRIARAMGKKLCVEYWGSDIRIGEIEAADNVPYAELYRQGEHLAERQRSEAVQSTFFEQGARVVLPCPSLAAHLIERSRERYFTTRQRIYLGDFTASHPDLQRERPVVLHAPSVKLIKGTSAVNASVGKLQEQGVQFEYRQVENMPHAQAIQEMADCDIYVDQLIVGSHGLAALEAMALGKVVVCYIKPSMLGKYPPELPIVSADPHTLPHVLGELLADRGRIAELGRRGRAYVEQYHDALLLARQLTAFYESL